MRKIYTSPRLENVQRMVAVMAERGIATKLTNRRVYDGTTYRRFSYARPGSSESWPTLWVIHTNDHARAREIVREMGIKPPVRYADELEEHRNRNQGAYRRERIATRVRIVVMVALVVAVAIYAAKMASMW